MTDSKRYVMTVLFTVALSFSAAAAEIHAAEQPGIVGSLKNQQEAAVVPAAAQVPDDGEQKAYLVRRGDYLAKILHREYKLSRQEFKALVKEICRINNIRNINMLQVGQKLVMPAVLPKPRKASLPSAPRLKSAAAESPPRQVLQLETPVKTVIEPIQIEGFKESWNKLVSMPQNGKDTSLAVNSSDYSLSLDPKRYPVLMSQDGVKIIMDPNGTMPESVRKLLKAQDPTIRIVSESGGNRRGFVSGMLNAARFYSVEDNFRMETGTDPRLTVSADFKVERHADSIVNQDMVLVHSGTAGIPAGVSEILKNQGITYIAPFAAAPQASALSQRTVNLVSADSDVADAVLKSVGIAAERNRTIEVFAYKDDGILLTVTADFYFRHGGRQFVLSRGNKGSSAADLLRILETRGYKVVSLERKEGFKGAAEKILTALGYGAEFATHTLLGDATTPYLLLMSGYRVTDPAHPDEPLYISSVKLDGMMYKLLTENGYNVVRR